MNPTFRGHITWLMGSNRVCHRISQVAVNERPPHTEVCNDCCALMMDFSAMDKIAI